MDKLLASIIEAHGGLSAWEAFETVEATIVGGGGFFPFKGQPVDKAPRRPTVRLHEERTSLASYGAPDQRMTFTPDRVVIEKLDGTIIADRTNPRDALLGTKYTRPGTRCIMSILTARRCGLIS